MVGSMSKGWVEEGGSVISVPRVLGGKMAKLLIVGRTLAKAISLKCSPLRMMTSQWTPVGATGVLVDEGLDSLFK